MRTVSATRAIVATSPARSLAKRIVLCPNTCRRLEVDSARRRMRHALDPRPLLDRRRLRVRDQRERPHDRSAARPPLAIPWPETSIHGLSPSAPALARYNPDAAYPSDISVEFVVARLLRQLDALPGQPVADRAASRSPREAQRSALSGGLARGLRFSPTAGMQPPSPVHLLTHGTRVPAPFQRIPNRCGRDEGVRSPRRPQQDEALVHFLDCSLRLPGRL